MQRLLLSTTLLFAGAAPAVSAEASRYDEVAVQKQRYQLANELRLSLTSMPLDPFRKGYAGTLSFTKHFSQRLAVEFFHVSLALLDSTSLSDELINTFAVNPEADEFAAPRIVATAGVEYTPLYGKWALLNRRQVHHAFIVGGYGGVIFGNRVAENSLTSEGFDVSRTLQDIRPSFGPGLAYRVYLSDAFSVRVDSRLLFSIRPDYGLAPNQSSNTDEDAIDDGGGLDIDSVLLINLGIAWNFGADI